MLSQFSASGKYFAQISVDGKLKIWNTFSNSLDQEFIPDFHLTSPCTCLNFIELDYVKNKGMSPKKKKRKLSDAGKDPNIALGTSSGLLMIYSLLKANVEYTVDSETSQPINCLSSSEGSILYSGANKSVLVWNLDRRKVIEKWKVGEEKVAAILSVPNRNQILTASRGIKLWDVITKETLKTFTGHSSEITFLHFLSEPEKNSSYIISGSKGDRILNCWNLNSSDKNAVSGFLMEDIVHSISVSSEKGSTNITATVRSGVVHIYQHTLNGKRNKPVKPKTSIQVVAYTSTEKEVIPLRIVGATYQTDDTLCIGYGSGDKIVFENINIAAHKKLQCLVRKDPNAVVISREEQASKTVTPIVGNDVHYLTTQKSSVTPTKRKNGLQTEIPMEQRLENLTLNQADGQSQVPKAGNVVQLLIQGLHSKDKEILRMALIKRDEEVIRNTVRRLPVQALMPLLQELGTFIQGKTLSSQIGSVWLRHTLQAHAGLLISNPELPELLGNILGNVEARLALQSPLTRLKGRIELLLPQVNGHLSQESKLEEEPLIMYNDKDSNDSEDEFMQIDANSESENEWEEDENSDVEQMENNVFSESE